MKTREQIIADIATLPDNRHTLLGEALAEEFGIYEDWYDGWQFSPDILWMVVTCPVEKLEKAYLLATNDHHPS